MIMQASGKSSFIVLGSNIGLLLKASSNHSPAGVLSLEVSPGNASWFLRRWHRSLWQLGVEFNDGSGTGRSRTRRLERRQLSRRYVVTRSEHTKTF